MGSQRSSTPFPSECGKTRLSLYGWRSGREFTKSTMPRARSSTKSTIRIFSSISSTTTSQQKIASSNSSRKSSENEKRERERVAQNRSRFKIQTYIYLFLCTSYLIHVVSISSPSPLHSSFPKPAESLLLFLF